MRRSGKNLDELDRLFIYLFIYLFIGRKSFGVQRKRYRTIENRCSVIKMRDTFGLEIACERSELRNMQNLSTLIDTRSRQLNWP